MTSREEMKEIADEAAERALSRFFLALGVDASRPEAIMEMQRDFQHLRSWRKSVDAVQAHSLKAAVTVIVTGFVGWLLVVVGFKYGSH